MLRRAPGSAPGSHAGPARPAGGTRAERGRPWCGWRPCQGAPLWPLLDILFTLYCARFFIPQRLDVPCTGLPDARLADVLGLPGQLTALDLDRDAPAALGTLG